MKRLVAVLLVAALSLVAVPAHAEWVTGVVTNPILGAVIVEKVATIDQSSVTYCVDVAASAAAVFRVQHRDATNTSTLHEQFLPVPINGIGHFCQANGSFNLLADERIRITVNAAVVGTVSVSLQDDIY